MATSRAVIIGIDTKRLHRFSVVRMARVRKAIAELKDQTDAMDEDVFVEEVFRNFEQSVQQLELDISQTIEYLDEKIWEDELS